MEATIAKSDREPSEFKVSGSEQDLEKDIERIGDSTQSVGTTPSVAITNEQATASTPTNHKEPILGKFDSVKDLEKAYLELQAEFTRKSQKLASLKRQQTINNNHHNGNPLLNNSTPTNSEKVFDNISANSDGLTPQNDGLTPQNDGLPSQISNLNAKNAISENVQSNSLNSENHIQQTQSIAPKSTNTIQSSGQAVAVEEGLKMIETLSTSDPSLTAEITQKYLENENCPDDKFALTNAVFSVLNDKIAKLQHEYESDDNLLNRVQTNDAVKGKIISDYVSDCVKNKVPPLINKSLGANMVASTPTAPATLEEVASTLYKWLK